MSWWMWVAAWYITGLAGCVWSVCNDLNKGRDFTILDLCLVVVTSFFGPIFTVFCVVEHWKEMGAPVLIKGKK